MSWSAPLVSSSPVTHTVGSHHFVSYYNCAEPFQKIYFSTMRPGPSCLLPVVVVVVLVVVKYHLLFLVLLIVINTGFETLF